MDATGHSNVEKLPENETEKLKRELQQKKLEEKRKAYEGHHRNFSELCCYKGYSSDIKEPNELLPLWQVCFWRFLKSRMDAHKFIPLEDPVLAVENE